MPIENTKYNELKDKAQRWKNRAEQFEEECESLKTRLDDSELECETLRFKLDELADELATNANLVKQLSKEKKHLEDKFNKSRYTVDRELLSKDGQIERLTTLLEDYKERYKEVREDNRELRQQNSQRN